MLAAVCSYVLIGRQCWRPSVVDLRRLRWGLAALKIYVLVHGSPSFPSCLLQGTCGRVAYAVGVTRGTMLALPLYILLACPQAGGALPPAGDMCYLTRKIWRSDRRSACTSWCRVISSDYAHNVKRTRRRKVIIRRRMT